jgi:hypothetical protein
MRDRGYSVARLKRGANRDQDGALGLAGESLETNPLGRDATSDGPSCLPRGRARCATRARG